MSNEVVLNIVSEVFKVDVEDRLIWGWAYVCTVDGEKSLDHSGEWVSPETMLKASTNFMLNTRTAKVNHQGDKEGDIIHSFPITKELALALGIQTDREGWIIGTRVSAATVQKVLNGELTSFSIGGRALKRSL